MEVKQVSFSYGDEPVLEGFSLSLPRGRRVAVMGKAAAAKRL